MDESVYAMPGKDLWITRCANCHGDNNEGHAYPGVVTTDRSSLATIIEVSMPYDRPEACDAECANAIADYLVAFNNQQCVGAVDTALFSTKPLMETLHSVAFNLTGRLPTADEVTLVQSQGEAGLSQVVDSLLDEDAFAERMWEIYNDALQFNTVVFGEHQKGLTGAVDADFGLYRWWTKVSNVSINDLLLSHGREPLELVKYVVANDLDFREIMTANYTMADAINGHSYNFEFIDPLDLTNKGVYSPLYIDPTQRPQAGIIGSYSFMSKHTSTRVNRQRKRAKVVMDVFLDTDVTSLGGEVVASADAEAATDILNDYRCRSCHKAMDPVASAFKDYYGTGIEYGHYRPESANNWPDSMPATGLREQIQGDDSSVPPIVWMAAAIAQDPRFARATVRTVFEGIFGQDVIRVNESSLPENIALYHLQQRYLQSWAQTFIESDYQIDVLVKAMVMSELYRADSMIDNAVEPFLAGLSDVQKANVLNYFGGSSALITPEMMLNRVAIFAGDDYDWGDGYFRSNSGTAGSLSVLFGGIDSNDNSQRLRDLNGFMVAIQELLAYDLGCESMVRDFSLAPDQRLLFSSINSDFDFASNEETTRETLTHIMWQFWGMDIATDSFFVDESYALLLEVHDHYSAVDDTRYEECHNLTGSDRHKKMAWAAVLTYLMTDYRFTNL